MKKLEILFLGDQNTEMNDFNLSNTKKKHLEIEHHKCRDGKERDRIKAVLLRSEGWTVAMIAQALRIHEMTVTQHINDYKQGKLTIESGGSNSLLNAIQTEELISHLESNTYQTTLEIISYIKAKYGITYTIPGMNKWLHRNNFSYKKPKGYPYKADKEKQEQFIKAYEELKKAINANESIMFMDSCHPSMATKVTHGWIKKGKHKALETTASRTRINLIGALGLNNIAKTIISDYETIDGEAIVNFMEIIRKKTKTNGTIHLILDRAGYHRSEEVFKASEKLNIKLHYLPPYSPNLNPIERLWKVMNEHARNNVFFKTATEFRESIDNFFNKTLPKIGASLSDRINDNFQRLNYAF